MLIQVEFFTDNGNRIYDKLVANIPEHVFTRDYSVEEAFHLHIPIIFIGASGIAVRSIAPFVKDKLTDSPVLVIDELGQFVIPLLSGHVGGANDLAQVISKAIGATPVITTATDINKAFAVDVFAEKNGLRILNKSKIKNVSSKILKGETIIIKSELSDITFVGLQPEHVKLFDGEGSVDVLITEKEENFDGLVLIPKRTIIGMGCKKDKSFDELLDFLARHYVIEDLKKDIYAITSIDVKAKEKGLLSLAAYLDTFFITFTAEELEKIGGDFSGSDFVKQTVGVDNVSERSAVALGATLSKKKIAEKGMTLAEANREIRSFIW
jgi:cobalt-precorrin 5A hydrolase